MNLLEQPSIYVIDDDEAVRDSLAWLLEGNGHHVLTFTSAEVFLESYNPLCEACLFVDVRMPTMSGLELQDKLIELRSPLPLSFITGHGDIPMAVNAMKKGAIDFVQKPFDEHTVKILTQRMLEIAKTSFEKYREQSNQRELLARLTPREKQVLEKIVAGRLNKQIADDMHISIKTVEAHRANLMEKFSVHTVADLLKFVLGQ